MLPHPFCSVHGCVSRRGKGDRCQSRLNVPILARLLLFLLLDFPLCVPGKGLPTRSSFQYIDFFSSVDRPKSLCKRDIFDAQKLANVVPWRPLLPIRSTSISGWRRDRSSSLHPHPSCHLILSFPLDPASQPPWVAGRKGDGNTGSKTLFCRLLFFFWRWGGRETVTRPFRAFKRGRRG